jgi:hypothetical protein
MATAKQPGSGKAVTHSRATPMMGQAAARMPAAKPAARINVPKATCKVCPGMSRR